MRAGTRLLRLDWIDRDGKLLILAGFVRAIAMGFVGVYSVSDLVERGASATSQVALLSIGGIGSILLTLFVSIIAEKVGRRRLLVALTLMSATAVAAIVLTSNLLILLPFVFIGALSLGQSGPHATQALWEACLTDTVPPHKRTDLYAVYHIVVGVASILGVLAATPFLFFGALFEVLSGRSEVFGDKALLIASALLLLVVAFLYSRVSSGVEAPAEARKPVNPFKLPSRRVVFTLTGLLSLNSLAVGMLFTSVSIHSSINWSEEGRMEMLFTNLSAAFLSGVLGVPALWLAAKIANRFGLVKTLVFTQMLSPLFFISTVFVPLGGLGVLLLVMYYILGLMSVPLRASYIMGVVAPGERVAMAGIVILGMSFLGMFGPMFGGLLAAIVPIAIPLFAGAALVIVANAALYRIFRNVRPPEEMERAASDT